MAECVMRLQVEAGEVTALLALLPAAWSEADLDRARKLGQLLLELVEGGADLRETVALQFDAPAGGAGDGTVAVRPTQLLRDLVLALRALKGDVDVVDQF